MLLVYGVIAVLTVGMGFLLINLSRNVSRLNQEQVSLRKEHLRLRSEHMALKEYCNTLEKRIVYLERSRRLLSHIVRNANITGRTSNGLRLVR
ncbi:hypothetical protein LLE49_12775 [Alicyclobacillus tolerans]|uniref:hypothetical protein n=1 Tax=Alicyclobacillus tolerans TaxID=90970 RepID=UPI001F45D5B8|nr:hypothetical protein [Alicyclobacillus tolerans]MCF8565592.1 hypothetical protein [Alicyclobacillus tolerans]